MKYFAVILFLAISAAVVEIEAKKGDPTTPQAPPPPPPTTKPPPKKPEPKCTTYPCSRKTAVCFAQVGEHMNVTTEKCPKKCEKKTTCCITPGEKPDINTQPALDLHNKLRDKHHSPPLAISQDVMDYAQNWANTMANADNLYHSDGNYGENIYASSDLSLTDEQATVDATNSWYSEVSKYNYKKPGFSMDTGHFTQVVWKSTKNLGLGVARSANWVYVCGSYDPPGNMEGDFPKNVLKP